MSASCSTQFLTNPLFAGKPSMEMRETQLEAEDPFGLINTCLTTTTETGCLCAAQPVHNKSRIILFYIHTTE